MRKLLLLLLISASAFGQQLKYEGNGTVSMDGQDLKPRQVRFLLAEHPKLLKLYENGRGKRNVGNGFIITGILLAGLDIGLHMGGGLDRPRYPTVISYVAGGLVLAAIPIKIGFPRKIKRAVNGYNSALNATTAAVHYHDVDLCAGSNWIGIRLTF